MAISSGRKWNDKEALVFLQVGTFLEYFDLKLYIYMAIALNTLFFPQTDPYMTYLLSAFTFCSTYIFRPLGAFFFGYIGDKYGRRATLTLTMLIMGISCGIISVLPTYEQWGYASAIILILCRIFQGMSSLGEIVSAGIYLTETIKPLKKQYSAVAFLTVSYSLGSLTALLIALFASTDDHWRWAFRFAAIIAFAASAARLYLRETPDFSNARRRLKIGIVRDNKSETTHTESKKSNQTRDTSAENRKITQMYFLAALCWPICFYFTYIYCGDILRTYCGFTPTQVVYQSLIVSAVQLVTYFLTAQLSSWIYPLKILKYQLYLFCLLVLALPFFMDHIHNPENILDHANNARKVLWIQCAIAVLGLDLFPALSIFYSYFPVLKRFTRASFSYALSRAIMYPIASFGVVGAVFWFGNLGLWLLFIPVTIAFAISLRHFTNLEKASGNYPGFKKPEFADLSTHIHPKRIRKS